MKGKEFAPDDLPQKTLLAIAARSKSPDEAQAKAAAKCAELTERFRIVAIDPDEREDRQAIIAEELMQRILNKLPIKVKRGVGSLMAMPADVRAAAIAAFDEKGQLKNPFQAPPQ